MIKFRSALLTIGFLLACAIACILMIPLFAGPRRWVMAGIKVWARVVTWLAWAICGIKTEVRGREHLPQGAALGSRGDAFLVQSFPQALGEIREARQDLRSVTAHGRRYDRLQKSRRNLRILLFAFPKEVGTFHYRRMAYAIMTFL